MTDETPRRKFGGKQLGAGRPVGATNGPSTVSLPADVLQLIDAARGTISRSAFVGALIRKQLEPVGEVP